jgi:hypothetical protein
LIKEIKTVERNKAIMDNKLGSRQIDTKY